MSKLSDKFVSKRLRSRKGEGFPTVIAIIVLSVGMAVAGYGALSGKIVGSGTGSGANNVGGSGTILGKVTTTIDGSIPTAPVGP